MFANDVTIKGLVSKVYQQFMQLNNNNNRKKTYSKMGRRPRQTLLQRGHTDGQQAHEEILNFANCLRNANQKCNKALPPLLRIALLKSLQIMNAEEGVEKGNPPSLLEGM